MRDANPKTSEEHQPTAPETIDEQHGKDSEDQVDGPADHNVQENVARSISCASVDIGRIVEQHIDPSPLLENSEGDPDHDDAAHGYAQQITPGCRLQRAFCIECRFDVGRFSLGIEWSADLCEDCGSALLAMPGEQPARTLRDEKRGK